MILRVISAVAPHAVNKLPRGNLTKVSLVDIFRNPPSLPGGATNQILHDLLKYWINERIRGYGIGGITSARKSLDMLFIQASRFVAKVDGPVVAGQIIELDTGKGGMGGKVFYTVKVEG